MKRKIVLVLVLALVVTLSACSSVNQEDYDALMAEKTVLETEKTDLQTELDSKMVGYTDQSVEAYGFTHGGYVGQVTIVVTNGVVDVEINEAFLPHTLAAVKLSTESAPTVWNETNTLTTGGKSYALYIMLDEKTYKALDTEAGIVIYSVVDAEGAVKTGKWDVKNLEMNIITNEMNMKAYYDALNNDGFKLLKSFGDTSPVVITEGQFKEGNPNYWQASDDKLGWQANIDATEAFLEENGAAFDTLAFTTVLTTVDGVEDTYWQILDSVAGATNSDFQDYFQLAQAAFGQLETEVK